MRTLFFISCLLLIPLWGCRDDGRKTLYSKRISNYKLTRNLAETDLVDHKDPLSSDVVAVTDKSSDKPQNIDAIYVIENNTVTTTDLDDVIGDFKQEDIDGVVVTHSPITRKPAPPPTPKNPTPTTQPTRTPTPTTPPVTQPTRTPTPTTPPVTQPTRTPTPTPPPITPQSRQAHQFTTKGILPQNPSTKFDVIWYLDNSDSMADSINQVKVNIKNFVRSVRKPNLDPKVMIISCIEDKQIQQWGSLKEKDGKTKIHCLTRSDVTQLESIPNTSVIHRKWGHKTKRNKKGVEYIVDSRYMAEVLVSEAATLAGQGKLRTSSKKIFVIVSDEEAHPASEIGGKWPKTSLETYQGFTPLIDQIFKRQNVRFFSFSAIRPGRSDYSHVKIPDISGWIPGDHDAKSRQYVTYRMEKFEDYLANREPRWPRFKFILTSQAVSRCAFSYSQVYDFLANYYGGDTFDVCQSNWSSHFSKLTNHVVKAALIPEVTLPAHAHGKSLRIIRAEMTDGGTTSPLSSRDYTLMLRQNKILINKTYTGPTTTVEFVISYIP